MGKIVEEVFHHKSTSLFQRDTCSPSLATLIPPAASAPRARHGHASTEIEKKKQFSYSYSRIRREQGKKEEIKIRRKGRRITKRKDRGK